MKNYSGLLREAFCIANKFIMPYYRNFDQHEELLIAANWSQINLNGLKYNFKYGVYKIDLPNNPYNIDDDLSRNFMTFFLEHIKAFREPYEQLAANSG